MSSNSGVDREAYDKWYDDTSEGAVQFFLSKLPDVISPRLRELLRESFLRGWDAGAYDMMVAVNDKNGFINKASNG